jgi:branched-chain amino acid transport system ATP-binding protein
VLELKDIHVSYGHVPALRGISLKVDSGEVVALIGANGAGKSTTLRAIQGTIHPSKGSIHWNDQEINNKATHRIVADGIAHCPEGRQVFPSMTVLENLKMGAIASADNLQSMDVLDYVLSSFPILAERRQQSAGSLSGGEQQMLSIGRALMACPKLLLLDEPSMGLAPLLVERIFEMIQSINDKGISILLVEQNAYIALEISTRAYVIESGEVTLSGLSEELVRNAHVQEAYFGV